MLLPDGKEDVGAERVGRLRIPYGGDVPLDGRVQGLGQHDVFLELAHRLPQADPLGLQRGVVTAEFVLAAAQRAHDPVQRPLCGGVLGHVIAQPVAAGEPGQELAALGGGLLPGVQILDHAPQFDERARHQGLGVPALVRQTAHGPLQHPVGLRGGAAHLAGTESGDLTDLAGELGRAGVERREPLDVRGGLPGHVGAHGVVDGDESAGLLAGHGCDGLGRRQDESVVVHGCHGCVPRCPRARRASSCSTAEVGTGAWRTPVSSCFR